MIKIVHGNPGELNGFDINTFYRVYDLTNQNAPALIAIASSQQEAIDAQEMMHDLKPASYHVAPPLSQSN